jgi:hypothetical protein
MFDRFRSRWAAVVLIGGLLVAAGAQAAGRHEGAEGNGSNGNPGVVPPNAVVFGMTYAQWGAAWWQWALQNPCATNVLMDPTGAQGAANQSGQVWFLAGGVPATRTLTVPAGHYLFFPLINILNDYPCPDPNFHPATGQSLEDFLTNGGNGYLGAKQYIDPVDVLRCEIDGAPLENLFAYRATSRLFTFTGNADLASCFDPCIQGVPQSAVADGYWLMLTPLALGTHTIHFFANDPGPLSFSQEETYLLTVGGAAGAGAVPAKVTPAVPTSWGRLRTIYR